MTTKTIQAPMSDTARQRPGRQSRFFRRPYRVLMALVVLCFFINALMHLIGQSEAGYMMIVAREGIVESLGAAACLFATGMFAASAFLSRRISQSHATDNPSHRRAWAMLLLALVTAIMFLEEIGWGLRIWAWFVPSSRWTNDFSLAAYFAPKNETADLFGFYWLAATFLYCAVLSILAGRISSIGKGMAWVRLPMPTPQLGLVWMVASAISLVLLVNPRLALLDAFQRTEIVETVYEFLFAAWAIEEFRLARRLLPPDAAPTAGFWLKSWAAGVAAVSFVAITYDVIQRTLPMTRSQVYYQMAKPFILANANLEKADAHYLASDPKVTAAASRKRARFGLPDPPATDVNPPPPPPADIAARENAIRWLQRSVDLFPGNDAAQFDLAVELDKHNRLIEAIPHYQAAVLLVPGNSRYQRGLGQAYLNLRDAKALGPAHQHLTEALKLDPLNKDIALELNYIETLRNIAAQLTSHPQWKEILAEFKRQGGRIAPQKTDQK